ncbi:MAG TPA: ubiquinol-cytochrome c reductase iron-sulfur subunit [Pyrinomonadaceae bacterium]|jgi:Rieske Fe-S protein|nr:ubiquinol-cytochrome c reductase iron-sulfur subunit [Pyrinomonadaceae bacterium]
MDTDQTPVNRSRRSFLGLLPLGVFAGVFVSISAAAFRFLRPRLSAPSEQWLDVATLSELSGPQPIAKKVLAEHVSGWVITNEEHNVFVLPAKNNQVLSPICPHEGCEVSWEQARDRFSCPCHESFFAADGARLSGPAPRGLAALPTRVQDGKLQVQYHVNPDPDGATHA